MYIEGKAPERIVDKTDYVGFRHLAGH